MTDKLVKNIADLVKVKKADAFRHLQIIKEGQQTGTRFTDPEFPPQESSLIRRMETPAKWRTFVWRRATEFLPADQVQVFDQIDPNDILQGQLGDCYFLSCLSVLAERPKLIERLFLTEKPNQVGCYAVWLNDNGEWKNFVVDDYFPCASQRSGPVFTRGNGPELWVLLLEKAYAKMHGSYDIIEGGDPAWALRDLTGAPWDFLDSVDANEVWRFVMDSEARGYLITCYTRNTDIKEEQNPLGIVFGHAYSILDAKEIVTNEGYVRLIRIRNPWGKFEWKGEWGDESDKWTENTKSQVNYENRDDGTFWMNVVDFVKYYEGIGICKLHENYQYKSISFDHKESGKNYSVFRLIVPEKTHIFLSVNQKDDRGFDPNMQYQYSTIRFMLGRIQEDGLTYIDGKFFNDRNLVLENTLEPGYYVVVIEFYWRQNLHQQANISAYSEKKIEFEETVRADYDVIQRNLLKSFIYISQVKSKNYANIGAGKISKYVGSHLGMIFFYYNNQENDKQLHETIKAQKISNLHIQPPYRDSDTFTVQVMPRDDCLVFYKIVNESEAYAFSPGAVSDISEPSPQEIKANQAHAYYSTTYIDDPNDKTELSRDVSYYDDYIKSNIDIYPDDPTNLVDLLNKKKEPIAMVRPAEIGRPIEANRPSYDVRDSSVDQSVYQKKNITPTKDVVVSPTKDILMYQQTSSTRMFDLGLWQNFPRYMSDDSRLGRSAVLGFERKFSDVLNPFLSKRIMDSVFVALVLLLTLSAIFVCFLRPQFVEIGLLMFLYVFIMSKSSVFKLFPEYNAVLRILPLLFVLSCVMDIIWLCIYTRNWTRQDITDDELLNGPKVFVLWMSFINLIIKLAFTLVFWWKVVVVLKNKK